MAVIFPVDDDDRPDGAAPQTCDRLQRELAVFRRLPGWHVELALKLLQDLRTAPDVAGRAEADQARVLAAGLEAEGPVERGHSDDINEGHAQGLGDVPQGFRGEVVEALLDVEEDGDEVLPEALVLVDDRLDLRYISVQIIPPVRGFRSRSDVGKRTVDAPRRRPDGRRAAKRRSSTLGRLPASGSDDYGL